MIHRFVLHNDRLREASESTFSAGQSGLLSGWGVFTTMQVIEGVPFAFERHWARITRDAELLHVAVPEPAAQVRSKLLKLIEANRAQRSTLRLVMVRNGGSMWAGASNSRETDLVALTADTKAWGGGVKLAYQKDARHAASPFAGAKTISWAYNLTWLESAQRRGFDEVILLNERGEAAECTSANLFIAKGGQVWTPPLISGCLPGITREVLLNEIHVPAILIGEKPLLLADLESAEEIFITSTTRNLLPVLEIEGRPVGRGGKVGEALNAAFTEYVRRYTAEHNEVPAEAR